MSLPRNWWNIQNISDPAEQIAAIALCLKDLQSILNKNIAVSENLKGAIISVTFSAANTNTQARHGLSFTPSNYIVVGLSASMVIYDGNENTDKIVNFKSSATGTARIFVF